MKTVKEKCMFKRAVASAIMGLGVFASAITYSYADFKIDVPRKVNQGDTVKITITADHTAAVKLSVTNRVETQDYDIALKNGVGSLDTAFDRPGSYILKATDSADAKHFVTQILHVQALLGGKK
jgi:hypothetical protein